jgi:SRSO17 transposase
MVVTTSDWEDELGRWLEPFLERLGHRSRQRMCPLYVAGLIGPGDRKSVQPMAERRGSPQEGHCHSLCHRLLGV